MTVFVESVRLFILLLCSTYGYELATGRGVHFVGVTLAACVGYVGGGLLGRSLFKGMRALEAQAARSSAAEAITGSVGALLLGALASLLGILAVGLLPGSWGWPVFGLMVWIGVYLGYRIGSRKSAELLALFGLSDRTLFTGSAPLNRDRVILDSSAVIDSRLLQMAKTGFLQRDLLVPRFVLDELQSLADSVDPPIRRKGRRGLETLEALRSDRLLRVHVPDDEVPEIEEVDAKLIALATRLSVGLMTNDQALASVAEIRGVRCLNLHRLAESLHPVRVHGDLVHVSIIKEGREAGEGVGFMDDGSMVVVAKASGCVGQEAEVRISSSVRTPVGRVYFATLVDS
jgi:uncharacterized protein YacL